jgi:hypothetical protein
MPRPKRRQEVRANVALVGDGQTERVYFSDVRDTDRPPNLTIFPDYPRKIGNYKGVIDRAIQLAEDYSRVYALIDMDKIIQDKQLVTYREHKATAEANGVIILENSPCFEIWLLLHFVHTGKLFNNCDQVSEELRRRDRIPGYDKSEKFLRNARLYYNYKTQLREKAISNAKLLENNREKQDELFPRAQTFHFFEWYFKHQ